MKELKLPEIEKVSGGLPFPWGHGGSDNTSDDDGEGDQYGYCIQAGYTHEECEQYL